MAKSFEELEVWQLSRKLSDKIYKVTSLDRFRKDFELVKQINRSSGSCMDNIAEGFERGGNRELIQFLFISKGSIGETRSQVYRGFDREYISKQQFEELINDCLEISKRISGFIKYLKQSEFEGEKFH